MSRVVVIAFMARLLDGCVHRSKLPETALGKQPTKFYEARHRNARFAHLHASAQRPVQHPFCNLNDFARPNLYAHDRTTGPILATFVPWNEAKPSRKVATTALSSPSKGQNFNCQGGQWADPGNGLQASRRVSL
ncbi:hypothetical protein NKH85_32015 [Mesorhizobium sp. M0924]|uniref:hypothetical protein n=1 Tax=unclassified Mesorhizobium TaxID=325217 RepID=UPI00333DFFA7